MSTPALVVNLSETGVQVLTNSDVEISDQRYYLELVTGSGDEVFDQWAVIYQRWSITEGVYTRLGFEFAVAFRSLALHWMANLNGKATEHLRCILHPCLEAE